MISETFPFDVVRAREAAALLLARIPDCARTRFHVLKLLYLAEREALRRFDRPICGGWYVGMPDGPVMSEVYDCMKGNAQPSVQREWDPHIRGVADYDLELVAEPPRLRLARADVEILEGVILEHGRKSYSGLWRFVHAPDNVPEYHDPTEDGERVETIDLSRILRELGRDDEAVQAVLDDAKALSRLRADLG